MNKGFFRVEIAALYFGAPIVAVVVLAIRSAAAAPAAPRNQHPAANAPGERKLPEVRRQKIIELSVVAATGGKPIKRFRVVSGTPFPGVMVPDVRSTAQWQPHTLRIGTNGRLDWPLPGWDELILRVEADGYQMQCSKWIKKGAEPPRLEFRLAQDWGVWGPRARAGWQAGRWRADRDDHPASVPRGPQWQNSDCESAAAED